MSSKLTWVIALVPLYVGITAVVGAWRMRKQLPPLPLEAIVHKVRQFRELPLWVGFLFLIGCPPLALAAALLLIGYDVAATWIALPALLPLSVAGIHDLSIRIRLVMRHVWSDTLGKLFAVSIGTVLALGAIVLAKHIVHGITHIDPKYLLESTGMLAALLLPVVYFAFAYCVLFAYFLLLMLSFPVTQLVSHHATEDAGETSTSKWFDAGGLLKCARLTCTLAVLAVAVILLDQGTGAAAHLRPLVRYLIVKLEYRDASSCLNLPKDARVAYMEDENVSVAPDQGHHHDFEVKKCKLTPDDDGAGAPSSGE